MKSVDWKSIAELLGIAAIVASLVFLAFQIKQTDEVARTEIFIAYAEARRNYAAWTGRTLPQNSGSSSDPDNRPAFPLLTACTSRYRGCSDIWLGICHTTDVCIRVPEVRLEDWRAGYP